MKSVSIASITSSAAAKIKSGTLAHIQEGAQEALAELVKSVIGEAYDASKYYILYGCVNTGTGLNYILSAGAIYYSGEIYVTPALTFTASVGEVARFSIDITYVTAANYDPVSFTDGSTHNMHKDEQGTWVSAVSTSGASEYANMVRVADIWHYVGSGGVEPAFGAGWANSTTYPNDNLRFYIKSNQVFIRGTIKKTGATSIFTLPVGYRPASGDRYFFGTNIPACTIVGLYIVGATGVVNITGSGAAATDIVVDFSFFI